MDVGKALELEKLRFFKDIEEITRDWQKELANAEENLAARGMLQSGHRIQQRSDIYVAALEKMVRRRIEIRKELMSSVPELATPARLAGVRSEIEQLIQRAAKNEDIRCHPTALEAIKRKAIRDLRILNLEADLGIKEVRVDGSVSINILNSTVGALNLGDVVGNIQVSVDVLQRSGHAELASAMKAFTEAVAREENLGSTRKDIIESLSAVGQQAVVPTENRRLGVVKSLLSSIRDSVATVESLKHLWEMLEPLARNYFWPSP
jgi:hypothetical protein